MQPSMIHSIKEIVCSCNNTAHAGWANELLKSTFLQPKSSAHLFQLVNTVFISAGNHLLLNSYNSSKNNFIPFERAEQKKSDAWHWIHLMPKFSGNKYHTNHVISQLGKTTAVLFLSITAKMTHSDTPEYQKQWIQSLKWNFKNFTQVRQLRSSTITKTATEE